MWMHVRTRPSSRGWRGRLHEPGLQEGTWYIYFLFAIDGVAGHHIKVQHLRMSVVLVLPCVCARSKGEEDVRVGEDMGPWGD